MKPPFCVCEILSNCLKIVLEDNFSTKQNMTYLLKLYYLFKIRPVILILIKSFSCPHIKPGKQNKNGRKNGKKPSSIKQTSKVQKSPSSIILSCSPIRPETNFMWDIGIISGRRTVMGGI